MVGLHCWSLRSSWYSVLIVCALRDMIVFCEALGTRCRPYTHTEVWLEEEWEGKTEDEAVGRRAGDRVVGETREGHGTR